MHKPLYVGKQLCSPGDHTPWETSSAAGKAAKEGNSPGRGEIRQTNRVGCGEIWKCTSKKKHPRAAHQLSRRKRKKGAKQDAH
ncbi:uncharacterized protein C11orf52 homolog isoform X2 [Urocitellus parryii]